MPPGFRPRRTSVCGVIATHRLTGTVTSAALCFGLAGCGNGDAAPERPRYQEDQARIAVGGGSRGADDPLTAAPAHPVGSRNRARSRRALAAYRSLDPDDRWRVRRAVARGHRTVWVYTGLDAGTSGQRRLVAACEALHRRYAWAASVLVVDRDLTRMIAARTPGARCGIAAVVDRFGP